jgi:hypothetical protein
MYGSGDTEMAAVDQIIDGVEVRLVAAPGSQCVHTGRLSDNLLFCS